MALASSTPSTFHLYRSHFAPPFSTSRTKFTPSLLHLGHTHLDQIKLFASIFNLHACRPNPSVVHSVCTQQSLGDQTEEPQVQSCEWKWKDYSIRYQYSGDNGPALVLIHGFGANSDHWRKNIPFLARKHRVYAIDLIGYGYSDKPNPRDIGNSFYTFETWAAQVNDFCRNVVKDEAFFICNSIGGVVGLQAAVTEPQICKGIVLLNISLRLLHITKQPWLGRPLIRSFQNLLRNTPVGKLFFKSVATPDSVRSILCQVLYPDS